MNFKEALIAHLQGEKVLMTHIASGCVHDFVAIFNTHTIGYLLDFADGSYTFRLAPSTITVNGVEVPAPESVAPASGVLVYVADPTSNNHQFSIDWAHSEQYSEYLQRGLVYLNKDDAIARAKAMLLQK